MPRFIHLIPDGHLNQDQVVRVDAPPDDAPGAVWTVTDRQGRKHLTDFLPHFDLGDIVPNTTGAEAVCITATGPIGAEEVTVRRCHVVAWRVVSSSSVLPILAGWSPLTSKEREQVLITRPDGGLRAPGGCDFDGPDALEQAKAHFVKEERAARREWQAGFGRDPFAE